MECHVDTTYIFKCPTEATQPISLLFRKNLKLFISYLDNSWAKFQTTACTFTYKMYPFVLVGQTRQALCGPL